MFVRLLGPVELRTADGRVLEPAGAKRCAVLALLAMELGRTVPVERFFELLWGDEPPAQARAALQGHIAALRKLFAGSPFTLATRAPGYRLDGEARLVDALHFTRLCAQAAEESGPEQCEQVDRLLREALGLWRGTALANLPETPLRRSLAGQLHGARTRALESWSAYRLRAGRGADAIPELERSVHADELHEPVAALLVRCLYQAGRFPDALAVYHRARRRLAAELGIPPGRTLQSAVDDILADDASAAAAGRPGPATAPADGTRPAADDGQVARLLPRRFGRFVGRTAELRWLDTECGPDRRGSLAVVAGPAGAGKTATVVEWAHRGADAFPDGQLFADLQGFGPDHDARPADVLDRFLRALGTPEHELPPDAPSRAALYRSLTRQRRLLVVLDNVRAAESIADLLPAGPGCATVVTSRNSLEDLVVTEGAAPLRLGPLPAADALLLLEHALTPARVRAEPEAAARLVELCDRLPLALRIAATRLAAQPGWAIAELLPELTDESTRLRALETRGTVGLRTALDRTVRRLPSVAEGLLALLAAHPGPETDAHGAAALLGSDTGTARRALGALAAHHLLTESSPGRYRRPELIRLYSADLLAERTEYTRTLAVTSLLDHCLAATAQGAALLQPGLAAVGPPSGPLPGPNGRPGPRFTGVRTALAWFQAEEPTVRALVARAAETGDHDRAWRLADLADRLYEPAGRPVDRVTCLRAGLRSARRTGEQTAVASLECGLAEALGGAGRTDEAQALAIEAVARGAATGGEIRVRALTVLAVATAGRGGIAEGIRLGEQAVALARTHGPAGYAPFAHARTADLYGLVGDGPAALRHARKARRLLADHPEAAGHLTAMAAEAHALSLLDRPAEAERAWRETVERCRDAGTVRLHAAAERRFADFLAASGRPAGGAGQPHGAVAPSGRPGGTTVVRQSDRRAADLCR
ncbi:MULTISPECIES: AfsR/SARP family transcriptional regulator [unclassified Kitasatospora]|uniref:AfsR/SARP family transcriptional regulator n=1 Tax=unclassified Kitasatospora TaxID=2633591 RepID=UPI00380FA8D3